MQLLKDSLGWGLLLWLVGYVLGIALFALAPVAIIGCIIMPAGVALTLWVLVTRIHAEPFGYYAVMSVVWTAVAIVFDYVFIVKTFAPTDGYYKPDVYLYYALTCLLPLGVGAYKHMAKLRSASPQGSV
jgi:hypothetical protein